MIRVANIVAHVAVALGAVVVAVAGACMAVGAWDRRPRR